MATATQTPSAYAIGNQVHEELSQRLRVIAAEGTLRRAAHSVEVVAQQMSGVSIAQKMLVQQGFSQANNTAELIQAVRLLDVLIFGMACENTNRAEGMRRMRKALVKQIEELGGFTPCQR